MIVKLPHWVLIEKFPAFNDFESLTAIEQTARVYGKINELIDSYNNYVNQINIIIEEYEQNKNTELTEFIHNITCLTHNYINTVDMKIDHQNRQIAEVYSKFNEDVTNTLKLVISELKSTGELDNAIYEAIDNTDQKINTFIDTGNRLIEDLQSDFQDTKSALQSDFQDTKSALQSDYDEKMANAVDMTHFNNNKSVSDVLYVTDEPMTCGDDETISVTVPGISDYNIISLGGVLYDRPEDGLTFSAQYTQFNVDNGSIGNVDIGSFTCRIDENNPDTLLFSGKNTDTPYIRLITIGTDGTTARSLLNPTFEHLKIYGISKIIN